MKISTRTRYGLRAMLELADSFKQGALQTKIIAQRQEISTKSLEHLMAVLKANGLVRSVRGAKGGFVIAKPPNQIKLSDVFKAFEGDFVVVECVKNDNYCDRYADCAARLIWEDVGKAVMGVLSEKTLQDAIDMVKNKKTTDYQI
jgi:Rrf2 family transcriptional regulator, cysteine metabolism repressor